MNILILLYKIISLYETSFSLALIIEYSKFTLLYAISNSKYVGVTLY